MSIVSAIAGFARRDGSFGALVLVHMTISEPFQVKAIGTVRGVPSLATYARRVMSRASSSWLPGRFRTSMTSLCSMVRLLCRSRS
ncbi:hypothetical protein [Allokutzneria sp. A3M-2-11 16]|uniref:hypothetical protein n=1 Tax=Allokutzneria sp. A3M-2-11 16 TaxID=2962043 RepID=UPI003F8D51C1